MKRRILGGWWDGILVNLAHEAASNVVNRFSVMYTQQPRTTTPQGYARMPGPVVVDLLGLHTIFLGFQRLLSCTSDINMLRYVCGCIWHAW